MTAEVERMRPDDWQRVRAIRLRALRDAPDAFGRTLAQEESEPPSTWQARLENPAAATFVARLGAQDIGLVTGAPYLRPDRTEPDAGLFAMWVAPEQRGTGLAGRLVDAVIAWARSAGHRRVVLDVADENAPAIRLYERMGFARSGATGTLPPPRDHVREHERVLEL